MSKANKRANGEGSLYQRKDGRWVATWYTPDNKRKCEYGNTQAEAISKRAEILQQIAKGEYAAPSKLLVSDWLLSWWRTYYKPSVRPNTAATAKSNIDLHLNPALGKHPLQKLRADHIQAFVNELINKGYKPASIGRIFATLHTALKQAEDNQLIARNPAEKVKRPKMQQGEINFLTREEQRRLLEALPNNDNARMIRFILCTGLRISEAIGLRWKDVKTDALGQHHISIEQAIVQFSDYGSTEGKKTKSHADVPKSKAGRRKIPLMSVAVDLLEEQRKAQIADKEKALQKGTGWEANDFVFATLQGKEKDRHNIARTLRETLHSAGINKRIGIHGLRHTFLTEMANTPGVNMKTISEIAGHSKVAFTLQTYTHSNLDDKRNAIEALAAMQGR